MSDLILRNLICRLTSEKRELQDLINLGASSKDVTKQCAEISRIVQSIADDYRQGSTTGPIHIHGPGRAPREWKDNGR